MQATLNFQEILEAEIKKLVFPKEPKNLYDPLRYFLELGGKRTRPTLTLLACELFGEDFNKAIDAALAVELFHNFTLIHDDIMDAAPLRRGKPTVHHKWNGNIGILSGDVMFVEAYKLLAKYPPETLADLIATFSQTAVEVCEGQQIDMDFEFREDVTIDEYIEMIRLKTSVLLGAALKMGGVVAKANNKNLELIYNFGVQIGIAFQLQDDILDVYANPDKFGKQVGGDIIANKKTFLWIKAFEKANTQQLEKFNSLTNENNKALKVKEVMALYEELDVRKLAENKMNEFYQEAIYNLEMIDAETSSKEALRQMAHFIMHRDV